MSINARKTSNALFALH